MLPPHVPISLDRHHTRRNSYSEETVLEELSKFAVINQDKSYKPRKAFKFAEIEKTKRAFQERAEGGLILVTGENI